ncbi:hypothetical protein SCB49_01372 [unidentified eubacterium SCB49]|nr:hypothetical protein SCB49_01372 [unidentified eubacterium SCB49]
MKRNIIAFLLLLATEIAIAKFYFTEFIRHVVGDVLVILLLYYLVRIFTTKISKKITIISVLLFAFLIEILQWFQITEILNITNPTLRTITGTTFDYRDMIAYTVGAILVVILEKIHKHETN